MDPIASCAEHTLRQSEHPTLKLSELLESVSETIDRTLDAGRLRAILERHPERFAILEPWKGPWRGTPGTLMAKDGASDPWVVAVTPPDGQPNGTGSSAIKLRESVRWLARGVDPRSPTEVSRWYAIAMAERAARAALARRAA
jgi:hypothetical protein